MNQSRRRTAIFLIVLATAASKTIAEEVHPSSITVDSQTSCPYWTPIRFSIIPSQALPPTRCVFGLSFGFAEDADKVNGIQLGIGASAEQLHGISIGVLGVQADGWGIAASGLFTETGEHFTGVQVGGMTNVWMTAECEGCKNDIDGVQIAVLMNDSTRTRGIQLGGFNHSREMRGIQIGIGNGGDKVQGIEVGIFNQSGEVHGFQFGVWNQCDSLVGLQLGVINIIKRPAVLPSVLPVVNFSW
jgi:hypothetical protein